MRKKYLTESAESRRGRRRLLGGLVAGLALSVVGAGGVAATPALAAGPPEVEAEYATSVAPTSATANAQLNPEGAETTYTFEYGTSLAYGSLGSASDAGAGETPVAVALHIQGLASSTTYHYRVVAHSAFGGSGGSTVDGVDHTFTTQFAGGEFSLPDGRQWELVTPPNKRGAAVLAPALLSGLIQASNVGGALAYVANGTLVKGPAGNSSPEVQQFLASRDSAGWTTESLVTPHAEVSGTPLGQSSEYYQFAENLSSGIVAPQDETPLPPLAAGAERTIYLRSSPTRSYQALVTSANVVPGAAFGGKLNFATASPNLTSIVFSSPEALTEGSVAGPQNLYEWIAGQLQQIDVLPDHHPLEEGAADLGVGNGESSLTRNAISTDGTRVIWSALVQQSQHLYVRDMSKGETLQLDVPESGAGGGGGPDAVFRGAGRDGNRIFFTDQQRLTNDSYAREASSHEDLYVFEVTSGNGPLAGKLIDLTKDTNESEGEPESAQFQGNLIGYNDQGTLVYFVADGKLAEGAVPGQPNLYADQLEGDGSGWSSPRLIAVLSSEDAPSWGEISTHVSQVSLSTRYLTARVSPSGRYLAFMSDRPLTGYDNRDANSNALDEEVYLYDHETGRLVCASCDPTGARPEGVFDRGLVGGEPPLRYDGQEDWSAGTSGIDPWLAGNIAAGTPAGGGTPVSYQPRYLTDSGRLFFNSAAGLVPSDLNHQIDVYEYGPEDARCNSSRQSPSEAFKPTSIVKVEGRKVEEGAGCVAIVSSGTSGEESTFLDASATGPGGEEGEDVFFLTAAQLSEQDHDRSYDIYDAHQCVTLSPCSSSATAVPPACSNADSCRAASSAQPEGFEAAASATYTGLGNASPIPISSAKAKPKVLTRAQKLVAARMACKKYRSRKRRVNCEAQARKRYGSTPKVQTTIRRSR